VASFSGGATVWLLKIAGIKKPLRIMPEFAGGEAIYLAAIESGD
jgi:hypothetical protein